MNLKEARKLDRLKQFAQKYEMQDPHPRGKERFEALLDAITQGAKFSETQPKSKPKK